MSLHSFIICGVLARIPSFASTRQGVVSRTLLLSRAHLTWFLCLLALSFAYFDFTDAFTESLANSQTHEVIQKCMRARILPGISKDTNVTARVRKYCNVSINA